VSESSATRQAGGKPSDLHLPMFRTTGMTAVPSVSNARVSAAPERPEAPMMWTGRAARGEGRGADMGVVRVARRVRVRKAVRPTVPRENTVLPWLWPHAADCLQGLVRLDCTKAETAPRVSSTADRACRWQTGTRMPECLTPPLPHQP
jgi:hypothetical protein